LTDFDTIDLLFDQATGLLAANLLGLEVNGTGSIADWSESGDNAS